MSATHDNKQKLLCQAKRDKRAEADANVTATAEPKMETPKEVSIKKSEMGKKADSSDPLPVNICAKALCSHITDAALP